jgi:hypothetical protein
MFDTGDPGALPDWLNQLETSRLPGLPSFAKVIREDLPAVVQAITSPYSSGVNEGRITDVKLQKRLMAGRAKIPLLRHRVVLIARLRRHAIPGQDGRTRSRSSCHDQPLCDLAATTGHH